MRKNVQSGVQDDVACECTNAEPLNIRDFTERTHNETALADVSVFAKMLSRLAPSAIFSVDMERRVRTWNSTAERITGYTAEEVIGQDCSMFALHPCSLRCGIIDGDVPKPIFGRECTIRRKDGEMRTVLKNADLLHDRDGNVLGGVESFVDITERKRDEERMRMQNVLLSTQQEVSLDGIMAADDNGKIISFNRRFVDMWGIPPDVVESKSDELALRSVLDKLVAPTEFIERVRYLYEHRSDTSREEIVLKDGRVFDRYSGPMAGTDGTYYGRVWYFRDITRRKQIEQKIVASERMHRKLFEASQDALMIIAPPTWMFISANAATLKLFGSESEQQFMTLGPWDVSPKIQPDGTPSMVKASKMIEKAMNEGSIFFEWKHQRLNGDAFSATVLLTRMEMDDQVVLQATVRDITVQKQLEIELAHAQKLESVGQLAAGIAHEINTPTQFVGDNTRFLKDAFEGLLKLIQAYKKMIGACEKDGIQPELLKSIREIEVDSDIDYLTTEIPKAVDQSIDGMDRIARIVRAMKEFSHPGNVEKEMANLNHAIETTIIVARNEWKYLAEIKAELSADLPLVYCFVSEINQVLLNLIVNAAHAIDAASVKKNGEKGLITITTRSVDGVVEIRVSDTGSGISEEHRARIFEPFFTTKPAGKGTGQGLALAYQVVKRHGGTISFATETGKGTTFVIRLPIKQEEGGAANGGSGRLTQIGN